MFYARQHNNRIKEASRLVKSNRHKYPSKFKRAYFVAWDGEGIENVVTELPQNYSLLANSEGKYLINPEGLSTVDCLNFLTSVEYPKYATHVCFGASYDVNMMLKDLPEESLRQLHKGDRSVRYQDFELEYRPRKSFTVRRYKIDVRHGRRYKCFDRKKRIVFERVVTLWDVLGFFQKKFTKVLEEWLKDEHDILHTLHEIQSGKDRRGSFSNSELQTFVLPYTLRECTLLKHLMGILQGYLDEAGLVLSRWDGAGAVAAAFLKKYGIKQHLIELDNALVNAAEHAYFGGWIEAFLYGIIDKIIYHYDLISAYPAAMPELPSLAMGRWEHVVTQLPLKQLLARYKFPSFWIAHIEWSGGHEAGPGPFQWRDHKGTVMKPTCGRAWQWSPEIEAVNKHMPYVNIDVDEVYYFVPDEDCEYPFKFVKDVFELRKVLKAIGNGMQIVYKLGPNSIYGKLAQSLGYNRHTNRKPPYHCIVYAGLITSITRAKLIEAACQEPDDIVSIATDGIYSLKPLKLDVGNGLGQWEESTHDSMVIVQAGFYWIVNGNDEKCYYRGMNEGSVTRQQIIEAYHKIERDGYVREVKNKKLTSIPIEVTRFVTLGAAIGLNDFSKWRTWRTATRDLELNMATSKRRYSHTREDGIRVSKTNLDIRTLSETFQRYSMESAKYKYEWDGEFDGQPLREVAEEMFSMELSPMD